MCGIKDLQISFGIFGDYLIPVDELAHNFSSYVARIAVQSDSPKKTFFAIIYRINDSGAFQEDELYFESLESQALAEPSEVPQNRYDLRYSFITKQNLISNNNNLISQLRRESSFINTNVAGPGPTSGSSSLWSLVCETFCPLVKMNNNSTNIQTTNLPSITTGSPNKLPINSMISPLTNNYVSTSIAPEFESWK
ncbi:unnamed protein product [Rhizophagus irregularis]|nr:unnamed protein product [Rhizophagus irregularis]